TTATMSVAQTTSQGIFRTRRTECRTLDGIKVVVASMIIITKAVGDRITTGNINNSRTITMSTREDTNDSPDTDRIKPRASSTTRMTTPSTKVEAVVVAIIEIIGTSSGTVLYI